MDTYIQLGIYLLYLRAYELRSCCSYLYKFELCSGLRIDIVVIYILGVSYIRNVFAYDLEGELVRDHVFIDIFSWNQCPPAIAHLRISYATVSVMIVSLFFRVKPATGNLLLSGSMWVHVGNVMHCKCLSIVVTWLQYCHACALVFPCEPWHDGYLTQTMTKST